MDVDDLQLPLRGFEDVTPISQDDGADPVVSIAYRHNCEWARKLNVCWHIVGRVCR